MKSRFFTQKYARTILFLRIFRII